MKELVKWSLLVVGIVILYLTSIYYPNPVRILAVMLFLLGCYLMFNPNLLDKTKPHDLTLLRSEFQDLFNSLENTRLAKEKRRFELLSEFKFKFFAIGILGCVFVLAICLFVFLLPVSSNSVGLVAVFVFGALIILSESEGNVFGRKVHFPFSRRERVKIDIFFRILKDPDLTNNILEEERGQLAKHYADNQDNVFSNGKGFNVTMNQYVVNNNDNRILNNNFITSIDYKERESKYEVQLDRDSQFWTYYESPTFNSTKEEKIEHFMGLLERINNQHEAQKKQKIFVKSVVEKNKFGLINPINARSEPIIFAGFVKYLLKEGFVKALITDISIRTCLLDIFEIAGSEKFKNFQPQRWNEIDSYVEYFNCLIEPGRK